MQEIRHSWDIGHFFICTEGSVLCARCQNETARVGGNERWSPRSFFVAGAVVDDFGGCFEKLETSCDIFWSGTGTSSFWAVAVLSMPQAHFGAGEIF